MTTFTCPICGAVSHNPNDARERYCGRCHRFVDDPPCRGLVDAEGRCYNDDCAEHGDPPDFPTNPGGHKSWRDA
jgi:hypothetical protein